MKLQEARVDRYRGGFVYFNGSAINYNSGCGSVDALFAFCDEKERRYYLFAENPSLSTCSVEVFKFGEPTPVTTVFLQEHQVEEALGKQGLDYAPRTIIRKLLKGREE